MTTIILHNVITEIYKKDIIENIKFICTYPLVPNECVSLLMSIVICEENLRESQKIIHDISVEVRRLNGCFDYSIEQINKLIKILQGIN